MSSGNPFTLATAATILSVNTLNRLIRSFGKYRDQNVTEITTADLTTRTETISGLSYSLQNLRMNSADEDESAQLAVMILSRQIHNELDALHDDLLHFPADRITPIIPLLDTQRRFWKNCHNTHFYLETLDTAQEKGIFSGLSEVKRLVGLV